MDSPLVVKWISPVNASRLAALSMLGSSATASAQQDFAIDLQVGQSTGLTPYLRDVVYVSPTSQPDPQLPGEALVQPFLADEINGWGTHIAARFHVNDLILEASAQLHSRSEYVLHHRGQEAISQTRRRPQGSYEDAGVSYTPLDERREVIATERNRGALLIASLAGGWQYRVVQGEGLEVALPMTLGLAIAHISEPARPYRFGTRLSLGAQASYRFAENFALTSGLRLSGVITSQYNNQEDAYRRVQIRGGSTLQALTSSTIQLTLDIGLRFIVR